MNIYRTKEWKGYGKHNYYWNEYRQEKDTVYKYNCHRQKFFDGRENNWDRDEKIVDFWKIGDSNMPEWLKRFIK